VHHVRLDVHKAQQVLHCAHYVWLVKLQLLRGNHHVKCLHTIETSQCLILFLFVLPGSSCALGRYSAQLGQTQCDQCTIGRFDNTTSGGATSCTNCTIGTVQSSSGQTSCKSSFGVINSILRGLRLGSRCNEGSYSNGVGQSNCVSCPSGYHQSQIGATKCDQCEIGRASTSTAQAECNPCNLGNPSSFLMMMAKLSLPNKQNRAIFEYNRIRTMYSM
jgi:hypothetical protein